MITTIQLHEEVKDGLKRLKETGKESYEDIILRLINLAALKKRKEKYLLIEQCKIMAEDSITITKEWKNSDTELNWE